jgi:hypothetical protein
MFSHLTDLALQRSPTQAVGFYLFSFLLLLIAAMVSGIAVALLTPSSMNTFDQGQYIGTIVAMITSPLLAALVANAKKHWEAVSLLCIALAIILAIIGGGLLGLIPAAYLTTKPAAAGGNRKRVFTSNS